MAKRLLIYGATGYTGRMTAEHAVKRGLDVIVAGRDAAKVHALADRLNVEPRVLGVEDVGVLSASLSDVNCVINIAGPFSRTAAAVIAACIDRGAHYLDTTGEIDVFVHATERDAAAQAARVMLMPGAGWDVVPSDCLALYTTNRVKQVSTLRIAIAHLGGMPSRGSLRTGMEIRKGGLIIRRDGKLFRPTGIPARHDFDFGGWSARCTLATMGDVVTAWKSTGAPNIEVYFKSALGDVAALPEGGLDAFPEGPSVEQLAAWRGFVSVEAVGEDGSIARAVIETDSGYGYTARAAVEIAARALAGDFRAGFQSPASAYGAKLAVDIGGTVRDLNSER